MKIYGLAFVKNGVSFDYPFIESLRSIEPLVEATYINVGISEDGTLDEVAKCPKVKIIEVDWEESRSDKGHILSDMTNLPLKQMREEIDDESAWVFYLQSDEVVHEYDLETIRADIAAAEAQGCDVVRFRYLHFFHEHNTIALHSRWYPQEIRAFKLKTNILSHGDAQTFSGWNKAYESDAHIYHYGHVREKDAYKSKMSRMHRYYNSGFNLFRKGIKRKLKDFLRNDRLYPFYGDHPEVMRERIARLGGDFIRPEVDCVNIRGELNGVSQEFLGRINAKKVVFEKNEGIEVPLAIAPEKSESDFARPWTPEFRLLVALSMKGVGLKKKN